MNSKKNQDEEEDITYKIFPVYRRKCDQMGIPVHPFFKNILVAATDAGKL